VTLVVLLSMGKREELIHLREELVHLLLLLLLVVVEFHLPLLQHSHLLLLLQILRLRHKRLHVQLVLQHLKRPSRRSLAR